MKTEVLKKVAETGVKTAIKTVTKKEVIGGFVAGVFAENAAAVHNRKNAKGLPNSYENDITKLVGRGDLIELVRM